MALAQAKIEAEAKESAKTQLNEEEIIAKYKASEEHKKLLED